MDRGFRGRRGGRGGRGGRPLRRVGRRPMGASRRIRKDRIKKNFDKSSARALFIALDRETPENFSVHLEKEETIASLNALSRRGSPLLALALLKDIDTLKSLVDKGADVNIKSKSGKSVLMKAVERLLPKAVGLLLDKGADASYQLESKNMNSLLLLCSCIPKSKDASKSSSKKKKKDKNKSKSEAKSEESRMEEDKDTSKMEVENSKKKDSRLANDPLEVEIGEMLIKAGCSVDSTLSNGRCALLLAVKNNKVGLARLLLEKGAKTDVKINGWSPLHIAVAKEYTEMTAMLLSFKMSTKDVTDKGYTALHLACKTGNEEIVQLLIDAKADLNTTSKKKYTPMMVAAKSGHVNILKQLVKHGASVSDRALFVTCASVKSKDTLEVIDTLLTLGYKINAYEAKGANTPLFAAVQSKNFKVVELLLEKGADVNASNKNLWTPLHVAVCQKVEGSNTIMRLLLKHGADVTHVNNKKQTALHLFIANSKSKEDFEELLKAFKAKVMKTEKSDPSLSSLLFTAIKCDELAFVKVLLEEGLCDPNDRNEQGYTALMSACNNYRINNDIISTLLKHKAELTLKDKFGRSGVDWLVKGDVSTTFAKSIKSFLNELPLEVLTPAVKKAQKKKKFALAAVLMENRDDVKIAVDKLKEERIKQNLAIREQFELKCRDALFKGEKKFTENSTWLGWRYMKNKLNNGKPLELKVKEINRGSYIQVKIPGSFEIIWSHSHNQRVVKEPGKEVVVQRPAKVVGVSSILMTGCSYRNVPDDRVPTDVRNSPNIMLPSLDKDTMFVYGETGNENDFGGTVTIGKNGEVLLNIYELLEDPDKERYRHYKGTVQGGLFSGEWFESSDVCGTFRIVVDGAHLDSAHSKLKTSKPAPPRRRRIAVFRGRGRGRGRR